VKKNVEKDYVAQKCSRSLRVLTLCTDSGAASRLSHKKILGDCFLMQNFFRM